MEKHVVILGAGPAGLTAAYELSKRGITSTVLEADNIVGGIARTESYKGYHFDIGGHRFYTKMSEVNRLWHEVMGDDFVEVPRLSRIHYYGKYFNYPLRAMNAFMGLGLINSIWITLSYLHSRLFPALPEDNFENYVSNRFGKRLYYIFFKTYTEKVWGIPCDKIQADWAAQRIKGLSLTTAVLNALFGTNNTKTLIKEFDYPLLGPGQMWERFREKVEARGGQVRMETDVVRVRREGHRVVSMTVRDASGTCEIAGSHFITSMPLSELIFKLDPPAPPEVLEAARGLSYRDFLIVGLIVKSKESFPDNWIYVHTSGFKVGRIQNFRNWSAAMVPDPTRTSLGIEYFCREGDEIWEMADADLIHLAARELEGLGLARAADVEDGVVIRQPKAYPVYDGAYRAHLQVLQQYLATFENLQTVGRNGMHRYNNQDHSMLTALLAARNILGEK
ncbi:MAG: FAD-dependent oxidoreductase, partial [Chloroflexota bacterium]